MTIAELPTSLDETEESEELERRTSYLELFFDLVFVFAITQVTTLIGSHPTAGGFARSALVLGIVWWAWSGYAWLTNAIDIESFGVRLAMLVATLGSFFVALAVPHAYDTQGAWFAVPYLAVRVLHIGLYLWGLRADPEHRAAVRKLAPWFLVAPVVLLVGGLVSSTDVRTGLWALALTIDVAGALGVGRSASGFRVSPAHFAERYALFVIIALGESIVAIGLGAAHDRRDATFAVTVAIAFAGAAALWWAYFDFVALAAERSLRFLAPELRGPRARDVFTFFHYPQVLGIIFFAVGAKDALAAPLEHLPPAGRWALVLGFSLPLLATTLGRYRVTRHIARERVGGMTAIVLAGLVLGSVDAVWLLLVFVAVLVATIGAETRRLAEARRRIRAGGPPA
jgi:low temperature requirement protein LtrA